MIEIVNFESENGSSIDICVMNVSTVSSVMNISVDEGNYQFILLI